jgi:hypothetical protein
VKDREPHQRLWSPSPSALLGVFSLRWPVLITAVVVWNGLWGLSLWLNGGFGGLRDPRALLVAGCTCLLLGAAALAVLGSSKVKDRVLAPTRRHRYAAEPFLMIAMAGLILGIGMLVEAWQRGSSALSG